MNPNSKIYTFDIYVVAGPMSEAFIKDNPVVLRKIAIRGDQTLRDLHHTIFKAFDREEEHMYEFQIGGKGPQDPKAQCYRSEAPAKPSDGSKSSPGGIDAAIDSLGLKEEQVFGYWFDYGDDWWHQINVISIKKQTAKGRFPQVVARTGDSPPQYDFDDDM